MREKEIKDACVETIGMTLEVDPSGSQTLKMILEFRSVSEYMSLSLFSLFITFSKILAKRSTYSKPFLFHSM